MKKSSKLLVVSLAMLLASCGDPSSSLPNSSVNGSQDVSVNPDTSKSETSFEDPSPDYKAEDVFNLIKKAAESTNFTINETVSVGETATTKTYLTEYTDKYIYYDYADAGYLALPSYDGEGTILYNFSGKAAPVVENAVSYTNPETKETLPVKDTKTLNPLVDALKKLQASDIQLNYNYYYSKNATLIEAFAYLVGANSLAGSMAAVKFALNDAKDELEFAFVPNFLGSDQDTATIDSLHAYMKLVGGTKETSLDSFLASYALPAKALDDTLLASLGDTGAYTAKVIYSYEGQEADVVEQEDQVVYTPTERQIRRKTKGVESTTFSSLKKGENGNAFDTYLSAENKVVSTDTGKKWEEEVTTPSSVLEKASFRTTEGSSVYTYFGYKGRKLVNDIASFDVGEVKLVELTVSEGKIASLHAKTPLRKDTYGKTMYFDVTVTFQETAQLKEIKTAESASYGDAGYDEQMEMKKALGTVYGTYGLMNTFTATIQTDTSSNNYKTTITAFKHDTSSSNYYVDTILFDEESVDTSEGSAGDPMHIRYGYYRKSHDYTNGDMVIPFKVGEDGVAYSSSATFQTKSFGTLLNMDVSPLLFNQVKKDETTSKNVYQLREEVKDISSHILGGDNVKNIIPSSLKLTTGIGKGTYGDIVVLDRIEYEFNGEDIYKGKEHVEFSKWNETNAPTDVDFSTLTDWVEPKTWKDGAKEVYTTLASSFGEEAAGQLPFLYNKEIEGNWGIVDNYDEYPKYGYAYNWVKLYNTTFAAASSLEDDTVSSTYMPQFIERLKENGFVLKTEGYPLGSGNTYYNETLKMWCRVGESLMAGITFLRVDPLAA